MNINIRKASIEDLSKVQELNHKLFELEYKFYDPTLNVGWTYEKVGFDYFKNMIENEAVFLAVVNNEIVGYLAGSICPDSYTKLKLVELDNMFILEEYRKYGIGSMLINEFKKYCLNKGVESIKVTASAKNKNAIAFYAKNGFEQWDITLKCEI
jgi:ribosomal protein S18 acetylase RimI-like enzyme